jgi:D-lyxose ketol-isomerase
MKRSEINAYLSEAKDFFAEHRFPLPPWSEWTFDEWKRNPELSRWCHEHQMGWDVTDFGAGDFRRRGLLLFCIRNGRPDTEGEIPYAEKIMIVREEQETPFHHHRSKVEDIIVRGGGNLIIEMHATDPDGRCLDQPVTVRTDGRRQTVDPGTPLRLTPGESITLEQGITHRFYAEAGSGTALVGEVSKVNDDLTDNYFLESKARFTPIEEDEPALHLLWNELPAT